MFEGNGSLAPVFRAGALGLVGALLIAYILGFKMGLGVDIGAASVITLVTTTVSAVMFFAVKAIL